MNYWTTYHRAFSECYRRNQSHLGDRHDLELSSQTIVMLSEHSGVLDRPVTMSVTGGLIDTLERLGVHRPTVVAEKYRASE